MKKKFLKYILKYSSFILVSFLYLKVTTAGELLDQVVAVINDEVITASELNQKIAETKNVLSNSGKKVPNEDKLRTYVIEQLINSNLQLQLAKQNQIDIDDLEINEAIDKIAMTNKFTSDQLQEAVKKSGISWSQYRENIKKQMLISRIQQKAIAKDTQVTDKQVDDYLKNHDNLINANFLYHVQNIIIPLSDQPTTAELLKAERKANEVKKLAETNVDLDEVAIKLSDQDFILNSEDLGIRHLAELPEKYSAVVPKLQKNQISATIRAANGFHILKLIEITDDHGSMNITQTHARHILLKPTASMTSAEARTQVDHIYRQLLSGKSFTKLAKKYSVDLVSAKNGGDLGWLSPGETVPSFEKTMNKLSVNQISKPVKSQFGWHIIQVLERKNIVDNEIFKKQKIRQYLQQRKFNEAMQRWLQELRAQAFVKIITKNTA